MHFVALKFLVKHNMVSILSYFFSLTTNSAEMFELANRTYEEIRYGRSEEIVVAECPAYEERHREKSEGFMVVECSAYDKERCDSNEEFEVVECPAYEASTCEESEEETILEYHEYETVPQDRDNSSNTSEEQDEIHSLEENNNI